MVRVHVLCNLGTWLQRLNSGFNMYKDPVCSVESHVKVDVFIDSAVHQCLPPSPSEEEEEEEEEDVTHALYFPATSSVSLFTDVSRVGWIVLVSVKHSHPDRSSSCGLLGVGARERGAQQGAVTSRTGRN